MARGMTPGADGFGLGGAPVVGASVARPFFGPIASKDGYLNLSVASERTFQNLATAAGREDWITDPRFAEYQKRRANWGTLIEELEQWSGTLPAAEVQAIFNRYGVPSSPYRTVKEALADPQIAHRQALTEINDRGGTFKALTPPFRFSQGRAAAEPFVSALGEYSEAVLAELGYAPAEIADLAAAGVIATG